MKEKSFRHMIAARLHLMVSADPAMGVIVANVQLRILHAAVFRQVNAVPVSFRGFSLI